MSTTETTAIRAAQLDDLPVLANHGKDFYEEGHLPGRFNRVVFIESWTKLLTSGLGRIFVYDDGEHILGAIGVILFPDINDGQLVAQEAFWYVVPSARKGLVGAQLVARFTEWAKDHGAARVIMVYLSQLMPDVVKSFYEHHGFVQTEISYVKEL